MSWLGNLLYAVPLFILLIGVLIFVHEGGHFLFAKLFGVKVHVFSLGFGPKLVGFQKGETLYKLSWFPIGGYVKMLGEDPTEVLQPEDHGRAFGDKPKWQRLLIIIGGPAMNLIFPLFLYFGTGLAIQELRPAEIGAVVPESPAHKAGIRSGDIIVSVDDHLVYDFEDLSHYIGPKYNQETKVVLKRGDETITTTVTPAAVKVAVIPVIHDELTTVGQIGIWNVYPSTVIGVNDPDSVANRSGLKSFDRVLSVDGNEIARMIDLERAVVAAAGRQVVIEKRALKPTFKAPFKDFDEQFEKEIERVTLDIPAGTGSLLDLGIETSHDYIAYVTPGGAAEKIGLKRGDRLVSLAGTNYHMGYIYFALAKDPTKTRTLAWNRMGVRHEADFLPTFISAGEKGDLGLDMDRFDNGFWGLAGKSTLPEPIPVPDRLTRAFRNARTKTAEGIYQVALVMKLLAQRRLSTKSLGGVIMIGQLAGEAGKRGTVAFIKIMALISLNLGLLNLLPIPVLDGGQVVFIAVEDVIRRPLSRVIKERVMLAGVVMVLFLLVFTTWNDITRLVVQ